MLGDVGRKRSNITKAVGCALFSAVATAFIAILGPTIEFQLATLVRPAWASEQRSIRCEDNIVLEVSISRGWASELWWFREQRPMEAREPSPRAWIMEPNFQSALVAAIAETRINNAHFDLLNRALAPTDKWIFNAGDRDNKAWASGWPLRVLMYTEWSYMTQMPQPHFVDAYVVPWGARQRFLPSVFPLRPLLIGLFVDLLFWSVAALFVCDAFSALFRWSHRRPGCCANCGYDLRGSVEGRCSECGEQSSAIAANVGGKPTSGPMSTS